MATLNSKDVIDAIIAAEGKFEGDPDVYMIVEYTNAFGGVCWGVTWVNEHPERRLRYTAPSSYILNPKILWRNYRVA